MICPHDHHECDNRGCRYGGCQGAGIGALPLARELFFNADRA
jgi:hypothetical protein